MTTLAATSSSVDQNSSLSDLNVRAIRLPAKAFCRDDRHFLRRVPHRSMSGQQSSVRLWIKTFASQTGAACVPSGELLIARSQTDDCSPFIRLIRGASPPRTPLRALSRGPLAPRAVPAALSLRSFAFLRGASPPRTPLPAHSRGPLAPRTVAAALSLRSFAFLRRGFAPADPLTRSLALAREPAHTFLEHASPIRVVVEHVEA